MGTPQRNQEHSKKIQLFAKSQNRAYLKSPEYRFGSQQPWKQHDTTEFSKIYTGKHTSITK